MSAVNWDEKAELISDVNEKAGRKQLFLDEDLISSVSCIIHFILLCCIQHSV